MKSAICTLFEGNYHFGVAALINSLYKHGFTGEFFIGYKGALPEWGSMAKENSSLNWEGAKTLKVAPDLSLNFLPVTTAAHFTNYKPEFILEVWQQCINTDETSGIFYFDPDIVNRCRWHFYENWINYGVALVHEVVWNDMPSSHPKRHQWTSVANAMGYEVKNKLQSNINAGFIGVSKNQIGFIEMWKHFIAFSESSFSFDKTKFSQSKHDCELFTVGDQDLLNLTAMCTNETISEFGPEGMDFVGGGWLMSHATGNPKPWKVNYLKSWIAGNKPSKQCKEYWSNANGVINCYNNSFIRRKEISQKMVSFLSRFYSK